MQRYLYRLLRLAVLFGLLVTGINGQAATRNILVLGDSISAGYGMSLDQGWVALFADELAADFPEFSVVNASISGETSGGGLRRLPQLLAEHSPAIVIIELGGNDGLRGYPVDTLRDNLRSMATLSADSGARVILVPVAIPPNYGRRYTEAFYDSFPQVAAETGSALTPLIFDGVATNPELMQPDGIHPTAEAQPLMLANVRQTVLAVLESL
jgi:acyl-CoA thioesterase-1